MEQNVLTTLFLPGALVLIMYGVGLDLRPSDFSRIGWQPRGVIAGSIAQVLLVPVLGLMVAFTAPLSPPLAVGVVIIAACPGGAVSNLISYLSRADVALSVSLTAVSSIITVFTIPVIVNFAMNHRMPGAAAQLPMIWTSLQLAAITLLPVAAGMTTRALRPEFARRSEKAVRRSSIVFLMLVIVVAVAGNVDELPRYMKMLALPLVLLNGLAIGLGWIVGRIARLGREQVIALMIETGIQNGALGITIPAVLIGNEEMAIPPAMYGVLMLLSGALIVSLSPLRREPLQNV